MFSLYSNSRQMCKDSLDYLTIDLSLSLFLWSAPLGCDDGVEMAPFYPEIHRNR